MNQKIPVGQRERMSAEAKLQQASLSSPTPRSFEQSKELLLSRSVCGLPECFLLHAKDLLLLFFYSISNSQLLLRLGSLFLCAKQFIR